jgi:hypothetical protein
MDDDEYKLPAERPSLELRETAAAYNASPPPELRVIRGGKGRGRAQGVAGGGGKMKTSVYLEAADVRRLAWLAGVEGRPQAEIIRDAVRAYVPKTSADRDFALFSAPSESTRTSGLTQDDIERMMEGFGEDPSR